MKHIASPSAMVPGTALSTRSPDGCWAINEAADRDDAADGRPAARTANSDHMAEEEREALADFRRHTSQQVRHDLGVEFAVYQAAHAGGIPPAYEDPDRYVRDYQARG